MKKSVILFFAFYLSAIHAFAQKEGAVDVQNWDFMVRTTARLKEIALRFHVLESDIRKYSNVQGKTVYPGKVLTIPVKVRPATWDPSKFNPNKPFLSSEDAPPQMEYEWNTDSLDPLVKDDFIRISAIQGDIIQTEKMTKHVAKIDRKVATLNSSLDSMKKAEFAFQYDEKDMNSVLKRMEQARQRYYAQGPLGKEIDSLAYLRTKLNEEINRLRNTISEYEYLTENAYYFGKNREGEYDMLDKLNNRPGEQLIAESNFLRKVNHEKVRKAKRKKKKTQIEPAEIDQLQIKDVTPSVAVVPTTKIDSTRNNTPYDKQVKIVTPVTHSDSSLIGINKDSKDTLPKVKPVAVTNPSTALNTTKSNEKIVSTPTLLSTKIEISESQSKPSPPAVEKPKATSTTTSTSPIEKNSSSAEINQSALTKDQKTGENVFKSNTTTIQEITQKEVQVPNKKADTTVSLSNSSTTESGLKSEDSSIEKPIEKSIENQMPRSKNKRNSTVENNVVQKANVETTIRDTNVPVELTASTAVKPLREKDNASREEIKKVTAQQTIVKEEDLLERYTESPDLAFRSLQFQEIPIAKSKNGPKYLAAADPITVLKAKIWVEQFRLEMTNLNFKKAESCLRKSLDINPNCAETWTYHAEMLSAAGRAPEALKEYMIATAIDPTYSRAYFKAAMLYESTNNIENAYDFYSRAIDVDSSFSKAYLSRAALSVKQEDRKSAIEDYTALIAVDKKNAIAYKERGKLRMIERNYAGAVEDFTSYLEIDDPSAEIFYRRGIAKVYTGKIIDGCNDFNTAVQLKYPDAQKAIKKYCE